MNAKIRHILGILRNRLFALLPLQDKVVLSNFGGRGMGDDPKYIALQLLKTSPRTKIYWMCDSPESYDFPNGITPVHPRSQRFHYHMATSKVWVFNIKNIAKPRKRKGQFYIQTWHGFIGMKKVEKDVESTLSEVYVRASKEDSQVIDLMYANNDWQVQRFKESFYYDGEVKKCDAPRESLLLNPPTGLRQRIANKYAIKEGDKIVLYAPTFRRDCALDAYRWNYRKVLDALAQRFGTHFVMLLRLHPNVASQASSIQYGENVIPVSDYPDMQELLAVSDVVISDYSSCMFEFGLILRRPVFIIALDLREYVSSDRSVEFKMEELPFPSSTSESGLVENIHQFDERQYQDRVEQFCQQVGLEEHGHGAEVIASIISDHIMQGKRGK